MTTPEDARAMFRTMLNQIPNTMPVSQIVLQSLANTRSVRAREGSESELSLEALRQLVVEQRGIFSTCLLVLENRIEQLEGRPGIPDGSLDAIMSEFRNMGGPGV